MFDNEHKTLNQARIKLNQNKSKENENWFEKLE